LYQSKVAAIISELTNANVGGKLVGEGSLSSGAAVPAQGIPNGASPLSIRVGENFNNNVSITIPKLLSGNTNAEDKPVIGQFTPLFPATAATTAAGKAAATIVVDATNKIIINANVTSAANATDPALTTQAGDYNKILGALLNSTTSTNLAELIKLVTDAAGGSGDVDKLGGKEAVTAAITSNITAILSNAAISLSNSGKKTAAEVKDAIAGSVNAFFSAGTLYTPASRKEADSVVVAATETVKSMIASVVGQQSILDGSIDSLNTQIAANKEAANDLLSANIVEASNEVKQILSLIQSVYFVLGNVDKINQLNAILLRS